VSNSNIGSKIKINKKIPKKSEVELRQQHQGELCTVRGARTVAGGREPTKRRRWREAGHRSRWLMPPVHAAHARREGRAPISRRAPVIVASTRPIPRPSAGGGPPPTRLCSCRAIKTSRPPSALEVLKLSLKRHTPKHATASCVPPIWRRVSALETCTAGHIMIRRLLMSR
jgi:hypothetical protein